MLVWLAQPASTLPRLVRRSMLNSNEQVIVLPLAVLGRSVPDQRLRRQRSDPRSIPASAGTSTAGTPSRGDSAAATLHGYPFRLSSADRTRAADPLVRNGWPAPAAARARLRPRFPGRRCATDRPTAPAGRARRATTRGTPRAGRIPFQRRAQ